MTDRTVTVIIVSYRSAELTIDALASLEPERHRFGLRLRAIAVDNASGDANALRRAVDLNGWQEWAEIIEAPRNGGFAYGNNVALERIYAQGTPDYVHLLNPDAQIRPGAIDALIAFLQAHPAVGIAGSSFENADGSDWPFAFRFPTLASEIITGLEFGLVTRLLKRWEVPRRMSGQDCEVDWVSGASMMIRWKVFEVIGGLDESYFLYFEETDFCRRARRAGFATWYVPSSRVMHIGEHSTQLSGRKHTPRRLPSYWFESRRRYFALAKGIGHAGVIDVVALSAHVLGHLKRLALRRWSSTIPHIVRDLTHNSILWRRNRSLGPPRCFRPQRPP